MTRITANNDIYSIIGTTWPSKKTAEVVIIGDSKSSAFYVEADLARRFQTSRSPDLVRMLIGRPN
jgi:hypothetical protein